MSKLAEAELLRADKKSDARKLGDFIFHFQCRDYFDAYCNACRLLKQEPKDRWTDEDAIEAVLRAYPNAGK